MCSTYWYSFFVCTSDSFNSVIRFSVSCLTICCSAVSTEAKVDISLSGTSKSSLVQYILPTHRTYVLYQLIHLFQGHLRWFSFFLEFQLCQASRNTGVHSSFERSSLRDAHLQQVASRLDSLIPFEKSSI